CGASLFMVLQAALAALLTRLGAGTDIPIGSPIAGRTDGALDELIGFFVNTLVLRTDTSGDPSFRELVGRVRAGNVAAYGQQDVEFERLVEVLNPARSLSRHPLFQVMLALQNAGPIDFALPGLTARLEGVTTGRSKFGLAVSVREERGADGSAGGLTGVVEYATDLFERGTVEALAGRLVRLLEGAVAEPERRIGELDILAATERERLLSGWNATRQGVPPVTVGELFAAQAERTPGASAVVCGEESLTYGELEERANRLAHHLGGVGVGADGVGGLCVERTAAMVVGLIGILKAGGAYLPLDPEYPASRLGFMLSDARAAVLVTQAGLVERLGAHDARVVCLDTDAAVIAEEPTTAPALMLDPQHAAYVIYTSGSTGTPKGVVVEHQSLANKVVTLARSFDVKPGFRSALLISCAFDAALEQTLLPLVGGGAAVVISDAVRDSPPDFWQEVSRR